MLPADAFREAVTMIGGQSATSRLIGLSQQAISDRLSKKQRCPAKDGAVLKIEDATGIPKEVLRPDLYRREPGITHIDAPASGTRHHFAAGPARAR